MSTQRPNLRRSDPGMASSLQLWRPECRVAGSLVAARLTMTQPDFDQLLNALTGRCIMVKRNGTETAIEVEFATPEERRRFFAKRGKKEVLDWMDTMSARLVKHHEIIKQLREAGLWDDAKVIELVARLSKEPAKPAVEMTQPRVERKVLAKQESSRLQTSEGLKKPLKQLLDGLDGIFSEHGDVGDTAVQERMRDAIRRGFIRPEVGYRLPTEFGMFSKKADRKVRSVIRKFLLHPKVKAASKSLTDSEARLFAFQDADVESKEGNAYDEYFGHTEVP